MLKVRVEGKRSEAEEAADALEFAGVVLERSRWYENRGQGDWGRIYLDVDRKALMLRFGNKA